MVDLRENWLAGSPDGLVEGGMVEIKCPYSAREEGEEGLDGVAGLKRKGERWEMERGHKYYY